MQVYLLRCDQDYHWLRPGDDFDWVGRSGSPVSGRWPTPRLELYDDDSAAGSFLPLDCLRLNAPVDGPVLSARAVDALGPMLLGCGELWPVRVVGREYWWFNCVARVDALSGAETEADWIEDEAAPGMRFLVSARRLVFRADRAAAAAFRVPELPAGYVFVQDGVAAAVARRGLLGFRLDLVWSAASGGVVNPPGLGAGLELEDAARAAAKQAAARAALAGRL